MAMCTLKRLIATHLASLLMQISIFFNQYVCSIPGFRRIYISVLLLLYGFLLVVLISSGKKRCRSDIHFPLLFLLRPSYNSKWRGHQVIKQAKTMFSFCDQPLRSRTKRNGRSSSYFLLV
jgi:hypothetical protein